ncbi:MAG TPA: trigger factor [candidate division Zixibacteria bacterium]|nr:trigger factor [candidate division Zixibacteria bacterium]
MEKIVHEEGSCTRRIEIKVSSAEIEEKYNSILNNLVKSAEIPGFRQGKAPRSIIEKKYGSAVIEEIEEKFIQDAFKETVIESGLIPLVPAEVQGEPQIVFGEDFHFTILVDVKPEITIREYKGISLTRKVRKLSDEDIDNVIESICKRHGSLAPVEGRASQAGDFVFVDFHPDGEDEPSKRLFQLDDSATVVLLDKNAGDTVEGHFEFPPDWPDGDLAGGIFDAKVTILELKELVPAELDEEFISNFGEDIKGVDGFRAHIRAEMEAAARDDAEKELRKNIRTELAQRNPIDFSDRIIEEELLYTIRKNWNIDELTPEQIDEIKSNIRSQIATGMTASFVIDEIAKIEKIEVSEDELKEHVAQIAKANNIKPDALYGHFKKEDKLDDVRNDLVAYKVLDFVIENAQITEE